MIATARAKEIQNAFRLEENSRKKFTRACNQKNYMII